MSTTTKNDMNFAFSFFFCCKGSGGGLNFFYTVICRDQMFTIPQRPPQADTQLELGSYYFAFFFSLIFFFFFFLFSPCLFFFSLFFPFHLGNFLHVNLIQPTTH